MAQVFDPSINRRVRQGLLAFLVVVVIATLLFAHWNRPEVTEVGYAPTQPVPYSHKTHVRDLGLDCRYCHYSVERADYAAIPPTAVCMNCHHKVKTDSPRLILVRESDATGQPIPWVKVHRLPDFVYFSHQAHVNAGVGCVECHGRVDMMIVVRQEKPLSMAWCLDCHRNPAPHLRPVDQVTNMEWVPLEDPVELGKKLMAQNKINPPLQCAGCHR